MDITLSKGVLRDSTWAQMYDFGYNATIHIVIEYKNAGPSCTLYSINNRALNYFILSLHNDYAEDKYDEDEYDEDYAIKKLTFRLLEI